MNERRSIRRRGLRPILLFGLLALLAPPLAALAHPADVYLQASYITVAPTQIVVELDLSPGVLVAPQVLPQLDTDGDQQISDAEGQAYVDVVLRNVVLKWMGSRWCWRSPRSICPRTSTSRPATARSASSR